MAQGYYTLQEAAQFLKMSVDNLKLMAQKGQIRSFQDRGTLRFRMQDIQDLARSQGAASDPELVLGDASLPAPKSAGKPASSGKKKPPSSPKTPAKQTGAPEVFDFTFDDDSVDIGVDSASGAKSKTGSKSGKKATPTPTGSDSDVRLVPDSGGEVAFSVPKNQPPRTPDSDVKVPPSDPAKPKTGLHGAPPSSSAKRKSQLALDSGAQPKSKTGGSSGSRQVSPRPGSGPQPADSGVRLVPMDSDSDVKLVGASDDVPLGMEGGTTTSDSNVRLERVSLPPPGSDEGTLMLTEEINLDEEIRKQQEKLIKEPSTKLKAKSELKLPASSPFELSDSDLEIPSELKHRAGPKTPKKIEADKSDSSDFEFVAQPEQKHDSSSDFDLLPAGGSDDFSLEASNEQVLQDRGAGLTSSKSGISLNNPADSGISLEEKTGDESSDFDLSLEVEDTPKPQKSRPVEDSDGEFELKAGKTPKPKKKPASADSSADIDLSLEADDMTQSNDSEFELNLEASDEGSLGGAGSDSDSEFELTLDDSGNLPAAEDDAPPQVKSKKKPASGDDQDIFDTDFDVPALDESDDASAADSELESSDFDIALDDSDLAPEEESGSQVVALDEDEESETVADDDAAVVDDVDVEEESSDFSDLDQDVAVDSSDAVDVDVDADTETAGSGRTRTVVKEKLIPAAEWGVLPVIFMLPCVIVMFLVGILAYEAVQTSAGLRPPGTLTTLIAKDLFGENVSLKK